MSEKPHLIFECDNCGTSFSVPLNTVGKSSTEDVCCPICRNNVFRVVARVPEEYQ